MPFPLVHVDTSFKIPLMIEYRDQLVREWGLKLVVGRNEEVLARGLLLARSRVLFGGTWLPVVFSAVLFGLGHFYQGAYGVVQTALFGVVLAVFTLRWGTLWPAIMAHASINMLSVVQLDKLNLPT